MRKFPHENQLFAGIIIMIDRNYSPNRNNNRQVIIIMEFNSKTTKENHFIKHKNNHSGVGFVTFRNGVYSLYDILLGIENT